MITVRDALSDKLNPLLVPEAAVVSLRQLAPLGVKIMFPVTDASACTKSNVTDPESEPSPLM